MAAWRRSARSGGGRLKVLFVTGMHPTPSHPLRGVIVQRLRGALEALGHEVTVTQLDDRRGMKLYLSARGQVTALIRQVDPQVIHVHFGYSTLALPPVGLPIVTSFYGDDLNGTWSAAGRTTWKSRLGVGLSHYAAWRSRKCIVVSRGMVDQLRLRSLQRKTVIIRDAIDPGLFFPRDRAEARQRLGIGAEEVLILFPHDVTQATKRVELASAAVGRLQDRVPNARLWIVNGKASDTMPWYYSAADMMLVTSATEGGPSSAKEALACGLPVVSVPVGDLELFDDAPGRAFLTQPEPGAIATTMRSVLGRATPRRTAFLPASLTLASAAQQITAVYHAASGL